jgi:hypothetical protein
MEDGRVVNRQIPAAELSELKRRLEQRDQFWREIQAYKNATNIRRNSS